MSYLNHLIKASCILFFSSIIISCKNHDAKKQLQHLEGYWEIKKVDNPYGKNTEYGFNETIEYISLEDSVGYRKKLKPQLDGKYIATDNEEELVVKFEDDSLRLYYNTLYDSWKETVIQATENTLIVKNERGFIYTYAPFEQINLTD